MVSEYKTIEKTASAQFIEKKSRFIGTISPCKTEEEAIKQIAAVKKENHEANHNVYAYIISGETGTQIKRSSDDGEPQGTAGHPVLAVLEKERICDVCVVVTRYFGGIMLGAGGLTRAYSHGSKIALNAAIIKEMSLCTRLRLTLDYGLYGKISYVLPNYNVKMLSSDFSSDIKLEILIRNDRLEKFQNDMTQLTNCQMKIEKILEKYAELM